MKFTIWEKNNFSDAIGGRQMKSAAVEDLELLLDLRKKFQIGDETDEKEWKRYKRLCLVDTRSEEQVAFFGPYHKKVHSEEVEIKLTKKEFSFLAELMLSPKTGLPTTDELIEKSIAFKKKIKQKQTETEEI